MMLPSSLTALVMLAARSTVPAAAAPEVPAVPAQESATEEEATPSAEERAAAIQRGVEFLLGSQEDYVKDRPVGSLPDDELPRWQARERERLDGLRGAEGAAEWPYEGVYRVRGGAIPSGYRVGGTSIACEALLRAVQEGGAREGVEAAARRSLDFVLGMIEDDRAMAIGPKRGYDVRGWGHAQALQFLLIAAEEEFLGDEELQGRIRATIDELIRRLEANTTEQGGWNYANDRSVSPFMTGATLLILFEAMEAGHDLDAEVIDGALDALQECRTEAVSYAYAGRAGRRVPMPGSSARSSVAELALYKAGRSDLDELRKAVDGFFVGWDDLLVRKSQQGTHVGPYGIAPYYFFFGHTYASLAIEELPEGERQARRDELARLLWRTREEDGTWNDRIFPRTASYSTAMVLLALGAEDREPYAEYEPRAADAGAKGGEDETGGGR